jgi:hypothetical protein
MPQCRRWAPAAARGGRRHGGAGGGVDAARGGAPHHEAAFGRDEAAEARVGELEAVLARPWEARGVDLERVLAQAELDALAVAVSAACIGAGPSQLTVTGPLTIAPSAGARICGRSRRSSEECISRSAPTTAAALTSAMPSACRTRMIDGAIGRRRAG